MREYFQNDNEPKKKIIPILNEAAINSQDKRPKIAFEGKVIIIPTGITKVRIDRTGCK